MMRKCLTLMLCSTLGATTALADSEVSVSVDGGKPQSGLVSIAFSGDETVMTFADNSQATASMDAVAISITYDSQHTAIKTIATQTPDGGEAKVFALDGRYLGATTKGLASGVYIVNGKKTIVKGGDR